jgi:hypothetical protein
MRCGTAIVLALAGVWLLPAAARADPAPTPAAPVVVAGVPVTMAQARERARSQVDDDLVIEAIAELTLARWVAGEAARHGVRADPKQIAAAIRRERVADNRVDAVARAQMAQTILRRTLVRSMTAHTHGAPAWGRAFAQLNDRWRAMTRCASGVTAPRDRCANLPLSSERCRWIAFGDLCRLPTEWFINVDLVGELNPPGGELSCVPEGDAALRRLRAYLARTAPAVLRRLVFDSDCDPQLIAARRRSDVVVALHAIARLLAAR